MDFSGNASLAEGAQQLRELLGEELWARTEAEAFRVSAMLEPDQMHLVVLHVFPAGPQIEEFVRDIEVCASERVGERVRQFGMDTHGCVWPAGRLSLARAYERLGVDVRMINMLRKKPEPGTILMVLHMPEQTAVLKWVVSLPVQ